MQLSSAIAVYVLFWWLTLFLVLPFGVRTDEEMGKPLQHGHAESAPHRFDVRKVLVRTTVVGTLLFALYYANWTYGWVTPAMLDITGRSG